MDLEPLRHPGIRFRTHRQEPRRRHPHHHRHGHEQRRPDGERHRHRAHRRLRRGQQLLHRHGGLRFPLRPLGDPPEGIQGPDPHGERGRPRLCRVVLPRFPAYGGLYRRKRRPPGIGPDHAAACRGLQRPGPPDRFLLEPGSDAGPPGPDRAGHRGADPGPEWPERGVGSRVIVYTFDRLTGHLNAYSSVLKGWKAVLQRGKCSVPVFYHYVITIYNLNMFRLSTKKLDNASGLMFKTCYE